MVLEPFFHMCSPVRANLAHKLNSMAIMHFVCRLWDVLEDVVMSVGEVCTLVLFLYTVIPIKGTMIVDHVTPPHAKETTAHPDDAESSASVALPTAAGSMLSAGEYHLHPRLCIYESSLA